MSNRGDILLEVSDLTRSFPSGNTTLEVLKGVSLTVMRGEIVMIMGPSGVGKSTLLNLIATLDRPTGGIIRYEGEEPFSYSERRLARFRNEHIGIIYQFHYLMPEFSALENVMIPRMIRGNDWKSDEPYAKELLTEVGLGERLEHKPNQLSGGEQQRVAIARALVNRPDLILADEPTGDLDRASADEILETLQLLNKELGKTIVMVTHDPSAAKYAQRELHLDKGRFIEAKAEPAQ